MAGRPLFLRMATTRNDGSRRARTGHAGPVASAVTSGITRDINRWAAFLAALLFGVGGTVWAFYVPPPPPPPPPPPTRALPAGAPSRPAPTARPPTPRAPS